MLRITEIASELSKRKPYINAISTSSSKAEVLNWFSNLLQPEQARIQESPDNRLPEEPANDFLLRKHVKKCVANYVRQPIIVSTEELLGMDDVDVTDLDLITDEELDEMFGEQLDEEGNWIDENELDEEL